VSQENDFVKEVIEHIYSGQWAEYGTGLGSHILTDGVGILCIYSDESSVKFFAGAVSGLPLSQELCDHVAAINIGTQVGAFYLSRIGDSNEWSLIYISKIRKSWIEPDSGVSAQMMLDVLGNIPGFVNRAVAYLGEHISAPIARWRTDSDDWWFLLMQHT
jgi:hypothetical protein